MTDQELLEDRDHPSPLSEFPYHSQGVERCVKLATDVPTVVFGQERRYVPILSLQVTQVT